MTTTWSLSRRTCSKLWLIEQDRHAALLQRQHELLDPLGLLDAESRGRLVEDHDLGAPARGPGQRDGLPLAARLRRRTRDVTWGTLTASWPPCPAPPRASGRTVEASGTARTTASLTAEEEVLRRPRGPRRARGPGRPSRCRPNDPARGWRIRTGSPSRAPRRCPGVWTPTRHRTSVDLPAPLSPIRAVTWPRGSVSVAVAEGVHPAERLARVRVTVEDVVARRGAGGCGGCVSGHDRLNLVRKAASDDDDADGQVVGRTPRSPSG